MANALPALYLDGRAEASLGGQTVIAEMRPCVAGRFPLRVQGHPPTGSVGRVRSRAGEFANQLPRVGLREPSLPPSAFGTESGQALRRGVEASRPAVLIGGDRCDHRWKPASQDGICRTRPGRGARWRPSAETAMNEEGSRPSTPYLEAVGLCQGQPNRSTEFLADLSARGL
jgi:hypothetical protein